MLSMKPARSQGHFDRWAPRYDRSIHQKLMFGPIHELVLRAYSDFHVTPHDVVDVGCGTGRLLESAGRLWSEARLAGFDASHKMVAEARHKHEGDDRYRFHQADASQLPRPDTSSDVVFSTMSFHHWKNQAAGLREVARILRPGGYFVFADVTLPLLFLLRPLVNWDNRANFQKPQTIRRYIEQASLSLLTERRAWRLSRVQLLVARKS